MLLCWPVAYNVYVHRVLQKKLVTEQRAHLVRKNKKLGGYLRWVDRPLPVEEARMRHQRYYYSGFVDGYGKIQHSILILVCRYGCTHRSHDCRSGRCSV